MRQGNFTAIKLIDFLLYCQEQNRYTHMSHSANHSRRFPSEQPLGELPNQRTISEDSRELGGNLGVDAFSDGVGSTGEALGTVRDEVAKALPGSVLLRLSKTLLTIS